MFRKNETMEREVNKTVRQVMRELRAPDGPQYAELFILGDRSPAQEPQQERIGKQDPKEIKCRKKFEEMRQMGGKLGYGAEARLQETLFYMQARFMEDFTDDFAGTDSVNMYFPNYQNMSHEQLRCYFTWRTRVRQGEMQEACLSFVFLYIFEIMNNIGVKNPQDGLEKLLFLWEHYKQHEQKLNRYMREWLKEYYIVKGFSFTPKEMQARYPQLVGCFPTENPPSPFVAYAPLSDYKYQDSKYFTQEFANILNDCFVHTVTALNTYMQQGEHNFTDLLFFRMEGFSWQPFRRALYCPTCDSPVTDRTVRFSRDEAYWVEGGRWYCTQRRYHKESGRHLVGYIIRRIEQFYRAATKFRGKITASTQKLDVGEIAQLAGNVEGFFACLDYAITEFYRLSQRVTVTVDTAALAQIRENALVTQAKLTVTPVVEPLPLDKPLVLPALSPKKKTSCDPWQQLAKCLNKAERQAVVLMLQRKPLSQLQACAKAGGQMLEVLLDTLNEKALELVNDNICTIEDTARIFEEYIDDLERVINCE